MSRLVKHLALAPLMAAAPAIAVAGSFTPDVSLTLDGAYKSDEMALNSREEGFALGHTELSVSDYVDDLFFGRATGVVQNHDGETELELEEAFLQTLDLPAGLRLRGGRFLSQIGYLNPRHPHTDDFAERPLLHRAFLGEHYFDDGMQINWVLPTPFYWRIGLEAFDGERLAAVEGDEDIGVLTASSRLGGDLGESHSWQVGIGYVKNRLLHSHEDDDHEHVDGNHAHGHGAKFTGEHLYLADLAWKWAPGGNNRNRQLRLTTEYARITDPTEFATDDDYHEAWYASAVYRFHPQWETGVRYGGLDVSEPHGDHFHDSSLRETSVMLTWKHSHFSGLRLQYTHQQDRHGFADANDSVMLQYTASLGDHDAHAF